MNNAQTNSDVQSYKDKLQELIEGDKRRKGSRKTDRKPFTDAWVGLVMQTGITNEAVDYFFDGIGMAEVEPLYRYASLSDVAEAYQAFLKAERSRRNERGCTMRAMLNLLALELIEPNDPNPLDFIARHLSSVVTGKRGKTMEQTIRKQIVRPLANAPISAKADMQATSARTLLSFMKPLLEKILSDPKIRKGDEVACRNILGWLEEHASVLPTSEMAAEDATSSSASPHESTIDMRDQDDMSDPSVPQAETKAPSSVPLSEIGAEPQPGSGKEEDADSNVDSNVVVLAPEVALGAYQGVDGEDQQVLELLVVGPGRRGVVDRGAGAGVRQREAADRRQLPMTLEERYVNQGDERLGAHRPDPRVRQQASVALVVCEDAVRLHLI